MSRPANPTNGDPAPTAERPHVVHPARLVGLPVSTRDGRRLGTVKEADAECFLIDVRFAFDYWLSSRAIAEVADEEVRLGITKREVGAYLVDRDCLEDFAQLPPVTASPVVLCTAASTTTV